MLQKVAVTGLNHEGEGVGRLENGKVVFIPFALPGEEVLCRLTTAKKNWCRGELQDILIPSPHRQNPPCPIYHHCGGCSLQHLLYEEQLQWKREKVRESISRLGGLQQLEVFPVLKADKVFGYRNKLTLHHARENKKTILGFYSPGTHQLVPVENCLLAPPLLNSALKQLSQILRHIGPLGAANTPAREVVLRQSFSRQELMFLFLSPAADTGQLRKIVRLLTTKIPSLLSAWQQLPGKGENPVFKSLQGQEKLVEDLLGKEFCLGPGTFFQVNKDQAGVLYQNVLELLKPSAPLRLLVDLHCGAGFMAQLAAEMAHKVIGIDSFAPAVEDARYNAKANNISNAVFLAGAAEKHLPRLLQKNVELPEVGLLNPPRGGCSSALLRTIAGSSIPRLIYVSCNPATLARDLKILQEGGYRPGPVQPVDMFPQTHHVESIVALAK